MNMHAIQKLAMDSFKNQTDPNYYTFPTSIKRHNTSTSNTCGCSNYANKENGHEPQTPVKKLFYVA